MKNKTLVTELNLHFFESIPETTSGVCDFETPDLCGYTQAADDDFDWSRHSGSTSSVSTGPSVDHSLMSSSMYILISTVKGALDKYSIIPKLFPKKVGIFIPLKVLAWVVTACWVSRSRLIYFWRNINMFSIFYFSKSTSINHNTVAYGTLWRWCCSQNTS